MAVAPPKAVYVGDLEAVNERVSRALSELFDQRELRAFLRIPEFTAS